MDQPAAGSSIFFFVLLAAIIFLPVFHPIFLRHVPRKYHRFYPWDTNWKKFVIGVALSSSYFIYLLTLSIPLAQSMFLFGLHSFISLFALLSALFIICTGLPVVQLPSVVIRKNSSVFTLILVVIKNVLFLAFGIVICNFIGTLAASVLLFPSFLYQNSSRLTHRPTQQILIIFFIILVGNTGGVLSPFGDPPLYIGYTNGVRFLFTFEHLYKIFFVVNGYVLLIFALIDFLNAFSFRKSQISANEIELTETFETTTTTDQIEQSCHGIHHLPFLIVTLCLIIFKGLNFPIVWPIYLQEVLLIVVTFVCLCFDTFYNGLTPRQWFKNNYSTRMEPVVEVLVLFIGLLFTMSAPISILTNFQIDFGPKMLFFLSGLFGAFLDNAAVYISFAGNAAARYNITIDRTSQDENGSTVGFLYVFFSERPINAVEIIRSLSAGSVLMGGCTLIGNAPNIVIAFMATRFTDRQSTRIKQIGFLRHMFIASFVLIPILIFVAFRML